jgi:ethanolamine ammonia-lyase small subunit
LYANNNLLTSATNTAVFGTATGNLNVGIDGDNIAEPLAARISNVLIYKDKGLSATEVLQNYNAQKASFGL